MQGWEVIQLSLIIPGCVGEECKHQHEDRVRAYARYVQEMFITDSHKNRDDGIPRARHSLFAAMSCY